MNVQRLQGVLNNDRDLAILALIVGIFILVTLSSTIGTIYFAMAAVYAIAVSYGKGRVIDFTKGGSRIGNAILFGLLAIIIFFAISAVLLGSLAAAERAVTTFASSFLVNFTIDNPFIKLFVFGIFIPIVETLFFFGVVYKLILNKARATESINMTAGITVLLIAGIATSFHFLVRMLQDTPLLSDLIFFGVTGAVVFKKRDLLAATIMHMAINSYYMAMVLFGFHLF